MKLVLCRHGETDFNIERRLQGKLDTSLNERGRGQAKLLAERLKGEKFDSVFSSPQKRCVETLKEVMKYHENKVVFRDELKEIDLGKYTGMDMEEAEQSFPGEWGKRVDNKYEFMHEGGESYKERDEQKIRPMLKEFREKYSSRKIFVLTHQGTGRLILGNLLGLSPENKMKIDVPNECIYYIDYLPHKTTVNYCLVESGLEGTGTLLRE